MCAPHSSSTDYLTTLFEATAVPLEQFQSARLTARDATDGVVPLELATDDGTTTLVGFRDAQENFDCQLVGSDEDSRCVPSDLGFIGGTFANSSCSEAAALASCAETRTELAFAAELGEVSTYYRAGARLASSYTGGPESCAEWVDGIGFEVGPQVPLERFAAGHRVVKADAQLTSTAEMVGSASLPPRRLRSLAYGGYDCYAARGTDGVLRCLPPPQALTYEYFADELCTQLVAWTQGEVLALQVPGACPAQVQVYARGDRHSGPVYTWQNGTCTLFSDHPPGDGPRSPFAVFPVEIPAQDFAPLVVVQR